MLYAILSSDVPNSLALRQQCRAEHLARLNQLQDAGRLVIAGPHPAVDAKDPGAAGFTGSLIIAEFDSLEAAQHWAETDPYVLGGVTAEVWVKPFKQSLP